MKELPDPESYDPKQKICRELLNDLGEAITAAESGGEETQKALSLMRRIVEELLHREAFDILSMMPRSESYQEVLKDFIKAGVYLVEPHGKLIYDGKKRFVIKTREFEQMWKSYSVLVSGKYAYGFVMFWKPYEIDLETFRRLRAFHRITEQEREKWWGDRDEFYCYEGRYFIPFLEPLKVEVPQGVQTIMKEVKYREHRLNEKEVTLLVRKKTTGLESELEESLVDDEAFDLLDFHARVHALAEEIRRLGSQIPHELRELHWLVKMMMTERGMEHRMEDELDEFSQSLLGGVLC